MTSTNDETKDVVETSKDASTVEETETTPKEEVTEENDRLTDEAKTIIDKYERLSDYKREKLVDSLMESKKNGSLRKHQEEALTTLKEVYKVEVEDVKEYNETELRELEIFKREKAIKKWSKENEKGLESDDVTADTAFLKNFMADSLQSLPVDERTEIALFRTYGKGVDSVKREKASQTPGAVTGTAEKKGKQNPFLDAMMKQRR